MKTIDVMNAYNVLGEAKTGEMKMSEVLKIVKARKAMRPVAEEASAFMKDIQAKASEWDKLDEGQRKELNEAVEAEMGKDVEVVFEKLEEESIAQLISANGFKVKEIDALGIMA